MARLQRGFSLVSAIFLLVVIAVLGTFALTLSTTQQQSSALDVMGSRAYQASRAGIEWGAYQVLPASAAPFASTCRTTGTNSQTLPPGTLAGTLSDFTVTVTCDATAHSDVLATGTIGTVTVYRIAASGVAGAAPGGANYVERKMQVTIGQ